MNCTRYERNWEQERRKRWKKDKRDELLHLCDTRIDSNSKISLVCCLISLNSYINVLILIKVSRRS